MATYAHPAAAAPVGPMSPLPPLPSTWQSTYGGPSLTAHRWLQPSAHFRAHHPAFRAKVPGATAVHWQQWQHASQYGAQPPRHEQQQPQPPPTPPPPRHEQPQPHQFAWPAPPSRPPTADAVAAPGAAPSAAPAALPGGFELEEGEYLVEEEVMVMSEEWVDHFRTSRQAPADSRGRKGGGKGKADSQKAGRMATVDEVAPLPVALSSQDEPTQSLARQPDATGDRGGGGEEVDAKAKGAEAKAKAKPTAKPKAGGASYGRHTNAVRKLESELRRQESANQKGRKWVLFPEEPLT